MKSAYVGGLRGLLVLLLYGAHDEARGASVTVGQHLSRDHHSAHAVGYLALVEGWEREPKSFDQILSRYLWLDCVFVLNLSWW